MANTKKEWANMTPFEKFIQIFVNVIGILIPVLATVIAYGDPVECKGPDAGVSIWCLVHPGTVGDVIGWIMLYFGCFWLSGVPFYFIADDDQDPWSFITKLAWASCILGIGVMSIF